MKIINAIKRAWNWLRETLYWQHIAFRAFCIRWSEDASPKPRCSRVLVKLLERAGCQLEVSTHCAEVDGGVCNDDALVYESARCFCAGVEAAYSAAVDEHGVNHFLLVFGESVEDSFYPFVFLVVAEELRALAAKAYAESSNKTADTENTADECNVCVLVYPHGKPIWYDAFVYQGKPKPAADCELAIRVFDEDFFNELKEWCEKSHTKQA